MLRWAIAFHLELVARAQPDDGAVHPPADVREQRVLARPSMVDVCVDASMPSTMLELGSSISALPRRHRRHVHCAGMDVPVLKMSASKIARVWTCRYSK